MKKSLLRPMLVVLMAVMGTMEMWAAGYTRTLTAELELAGYKAKQLYDFQKNDPAVLPTEGDLRYRDGDIWGLHNFGSGSRSASVAIPVEEGNVLVLQHYSTVVASINCGTLNENLTTSAGYEVYDITTTANEITFTIARYGGIVAALVMEKDESVQTADYTINYVCDNVTVKTISGTGAVGSSIIIESSFFVEGVKYITDEGQAAQLVIAAGTNELSINVHVADTYAYTANATFEEAVVAKVAEGSVYAGEEASLIIPGLVNNNGSLIRKTSSDAKSYVYKFTPEANNHIENIAYAATDFTDVVFFSEAEDIETLEPVTSGYLPERFSAGKGAYAKDEAKVITNLAPGKYKLTAHIMGTQSVATFTFKAGETTIWENATSNQSFYIGTGITGEEFTIEQATDITLEPAGGDGSSSKVVNSVDFIFIQKTGDVEAPAIEPAYGEIWSGEKVFPTDGYDAIELSTAYFKDFVKAGDIVKVTLKPESEARAEGPKRTITLGSLALLAADQTTIAEDDQIDKSAEEYEFEIEESWIEPLSTGDKIYVRGQNLTITKIELIEGKAPAEDSELMKEAKELASDADAVAVGKLLDAIAAAEESGDESNLQAAIDQFKQDNADQEKDQTAKVATNGWKKFDGSAAGVCATQFAPAITTYDGRTAQLAEVYEGDANGINRTGTIIYQDIAGLENGSYKVGFYGNAFYTSGRGFDSPMADNAEDVAYVFANDQKAFITAHIAASTTENDFRSFDVQVTDGNIKLGMGKEQAGTNWHTMQIYQLTWFATAKEVYAQDKADAQELIEEATALKDELPEAYQTQIEEAMNNLEDALNSNKLNIEEFEAILKDLQDAVETAKAVQKAANDILPKMKALTESTNFVTAEALNTYYTQWKDKYEAGTLTIAEANALEDPYQVLNWHAANKVDDFLLSTWPEANPTYADPWAGTLYINTWSTEGINDGSDFVVPFFEYWTGDGDSLGEKTWTGTIDVEAEGEYRITAKVRVRVKNGETTPTGITLQLNEGEAVDVTAGEQVGESQFFLADYTVKGDALDNKLNLKFIIAADNNISWLSFKDVKYFSTDPTAISEVGTKEMTNGAIYNLQGQKVQNAQKGLFIINGKKVVVK